MPRKAAPAKQALAFEGDFDIFSIHVQWEKALPLLAQEGGSVELDLGAVGDLDLSGLQLLGALDRDLRAKGCQVTVVGVREEWKTRFQALGIGQLFGGMHP